MFGMPNEIYEKERMLKEINRSILATQVLPAGESFRWGSKAIRSSRFRFLLLSVFLCCQVWAEGSPRPASPGGVTDKPYIRQPDSGIAIGGYIYWGNSLP